jgi:multicomponent Na+:H+ antiporter subunit B
MAETNEQNKDKFAKFVDWVNADDDVPPHEEDVDESDDEHDSFDHDEDEQPESSGDLYETEDFHMGVVDEEFDYSEMFENEADRISQDKETAALAKSGIRRVLLRKGVRERFRTTQLFFTVLSVLLTTAIVGVLLLTLSYMPQFGAPDNPTNNEVYRRYIERGVSETGATNIVAAIILDYRAFDTLGEAFVLFTALIAVIMLVRTSCGSQFILVEPRQPLMLRFMIMIISPFIVIYGIYILFNGHLTPGGGFSGGAILGSALSLYAITFGPQKVRTIFSFKTAMVLIGIALLFYALVKGYAFVMGASGLSTGIPLGTPGNLLSGGLILPLNISVGIVVASTVYGLYALFSEGEV